jgi:hypothetical protein
MAKKTLRRADCLEYVNRGMRAVETGDDAAVLRWMRQAVLTYRLGALNESRGYRDDRRAGASGRPPIAVNPEMLTYALSLPPARGGRGRKDSRWRQAVEKYHRDADEAEQKRLVDQLRRAAKK